MAKGLFAANPDARIVSNNKIDHQDTMKCLEQDSECVKKADGPVSPDRSISTITRQVSHDGFVSIEKESKEASDGSFRVSPVRCVSEFDRVTCQEILSKQLHDICATTGVPALPNPLRNRRFLSHHTLSLRIESELLPLRVIIGRLMSNNTYNKKGLFNSPVDPIALQLPDYFTLIKTPMDLGTVKNRLYSLEYKSRDEAVSDIRLCFTNAMTYNHPQNYVHIVAKEMLRFFHGQLEQICSKASSSPPKHDSSCYTPTTAPHLSTASEGPAANLSAHINSHKEAPQNNRRSKAPHSCQSCRGNVCSICTQGCLQMEPTLVVCVGPHCASKRIRRGAVFYTSKDGDRQYCQRCYSGLSAVLPEKGAVCRYKSDLLKRKNDEEIVEHWVSCSVCLAPSHQVCALFNPYVHDGESYVCPSCLGFDPQDKASNAVDGFTPYSFVTGRTVPVPVGELGSNVSVEGGVVLGADSLPKSNLAAFIEEKVRTILGLSDCPNAAATINVRVISDCDKTFTVPEVIRKHFEQACNPSDLGGVPPPSTVPYKSKAIMLFQKIDGLDVCIFCMYVHEYEDFSGYSVDQEKRVYVAYLDSVEYFRPRSSRTQVYHEIITAYLATARKRGFTAAHIWACPPSRGNSFVFWNHPSAQRTPTMDRLISWYHAALSRAARCGVITDVMSQYDSDFKTSVRRISCAETSANRMPCPPLIDGDYWIEEALRLYGATVARRSKELLQNLKSPPPQLERPESCPALATAAMLRNKIIALPTALAFRRPVNASAMNLKNYHSIIATPMDLGTVHTKCLLGEYRTLRDLVDDVELTFANAKKYNPPNNIVHIAAINLEHVFFSQLDALTQTWRDASNNCDRHSWTHFESTSLELSSRIGATPASSTCLNGSQGILTHEEGGTRKLTSDITGGPHAIEERMAGCDSEGSENSQPKKKYIKKNKRKKSTVVEEPLPKRRRQTWLGEEVANSVRQMRTSIFKCSLGSPSLRDSTAKAHSNDFDQYVSSFNLAKDVGPDSPVSNTRQGFLEFCQFRNLEFDTLRRAKYSSSILLHHLHHHGAPGLVPSCSSCGMDIVGVRWHRMGRVTELLVEPTVEPNKTKIVSHSTPTELCSDCFDAQSAHLMNFIPVPVSTYKR